MLRSLESIDESYICLSYALVRVRQIVHRYLLYGKRGLNYPRINDLEKSLIFAQYAFAKFTK